MNKITNPKYIDLDRFRLNFYGHKVRLMTAKYIHRYYQLLNAIAPDKYELNTNHLLATIECKDTCLTVVRFSANPFKNGLIETSDLDGFKFSDLTKQ